MTLLELQPVVTYLQANQIKIETASTSQSGAVSFELVMPSGSRRNLRFTSRLLAYLTGVQIEGHMKTYEFVRRLEEQGNQELAHIL
jgi:hypothetical protein